MRPRWNGRDPWKEEAKYLDRIADVVPFGLIGNDPAIKSQTDQLVATLREIAAKNFGIETMDLDFYRALYVGVSSMREFVATGFDEIKNDVSEEAAIGMHGILLAMLNVCRVLVEQTHEQ